MKKNNGYVYILKSNGKMKAGITKNSLKARIKNYETHNPEGVELLHFVFCSNYQELENKIHEKMGVTDTGSDWVDYDKIKVVDCEKQMNTYSKQNKPEKIVYNEKFSVTSMSTKKIPFTQIANSVLNNPEITARAKGLFAYLYSKPDTWNFNYIRIAKDHKESKNTILKTLKELESFGYLTREKLPDGRSVYHLTFEPNTKDRSEATEQPNTKIARDQNSQRPKLGTISNKDIKVIKNKSKLPDGDKVLSQQIVDIIFAFEENIDIANKMNYGNQTERKSCKLLIEDKGFDKVMGAIGVYAQLMEIKENNKNNAEVMKEFKYLPEMFTPYYLLKRWKKLEGFMGRAWTQQQDLQGNFL